MAARAFVFEKPTVGPEPTIAGAPTSRRNLLSLTGELQPMTPITPVEASGFVTPVDVISGKEWSEGSFSAPVAFNDLLFLASGYLCQPYVVADVANAAVQHWLYRPHGFNPDIFQSYLIEEGSTGGAQSAPGCFFNSMDFSWDEKKVEVKGKLFGQVMSDGISLGAGAVNVPLLPASADQVNVYVASTYAALGNYAAPGASHLSGILAGSLKMPNRFGQIMTLDGTTRTWSQIVQKKGVPTAQIVTLQDTPANAYMTQLRAKALGYCRIECVGPPIPGGGGMAYRFAVTFPFKWLKSTRQATQDAYAGTYDMQLLYDPSFAGGVGGYVEYAIDTDYTLAASGLAGGALGSGG